MSTKIKRGISLVLSMIILCLIPISAAAESEEIIIAAYTPKLFDSAGPNVEALESFVDIDVFRAYLINGLASCPESLDISSFGITYTDASFNAVCDYIFYETPEIFHVSRMGASIGGGKIKTLRPTYRYTATVYSTMLKEFYEGANTLLKGIKGNPSLTEVEKALLLHDRLAIWCEYDYARLQAGTMPHESYTAYGALSSKLAVCQGYALAYDYLLLQVGIDSYLCSSDLINHAWNIVYIDNIKYHVDVTWDDPVWDISGRVHHDNFLRSTSGMISTEHVKNNSIDYDSSPVDTTYDNYYWQSSTTAFQLVGEDIYYIDGSSATLNKISNGITTICRSVDAYWKASASSYWKGNFSRLASDGKNLLFSLPDAVYKYDIETGSSTKLFTPETASNSYYSIYGFKYEDCKIICEVLGSPNYDANTKKNFTQTKTHHTESDWEILKAPTPASKGTKAKLCINCGLKLDEASIPSISVTAKESAVIDYDNALIFTDAFTCQDINKLVSVTSSTTIAYDSSKPFYGTGTVINVLVDGEAVYSFTLIVNGDINGDSACDVLDLAVAQLYSSGRSTPDITEIYAANCGIADTIDETTYQNLVNKALNI